VYNQTEDVFTVASPWGQILDVLSRLTQMNLFYIEDSVTELNINTAQRANSIYGLARLAGYDPQRALTASGEISIVHNGKIPSSMSGNYCLIPNFVNLRCENNGLNYVGITGSNDMKIDIFNDRSQKFLRVLQGKFDQQTFTGTGLSLQSFEANQLNKDLVDHNNINVYVNGEKWRKYDSFIDIPKNSKGYIAKTGITSGVDIYFGNYNHGVIPDNGSTITLQYLLTDGYAGNLADSDDISFKFVDSGYDIDGNQIELNDIFNIKVQNQISFGSSSENVELTRLIAPLQSRSFVLAQTSNYRQFFEQLKKYSRINVWTETDKFDPYIDLVIFALLVPDLNILYTESQDYFNLPIKKFGIDNYEKYKIQNLIEQTGNMIMGSVLHIEDPVYNRYMINVYLNTFIGWDKQKIQDDIRIKISQYLTGFKRSDFLPKSDLIAIIEAIAGVDSVFVEFISEDVENELRTLCDSENYLTSNVPLSEEEMELLERFHEGYSYYENNTQVFEVDSFIQNDLNMPESVDDLNINTKLRYILTLPAVQTFIKKYIDYNGDIILNKNEIPLVRGGWYDRYGRIVRDNIAINKLGPLNVYFKRENSDYLDYYQNKLLTSTLRNN